MKTAISLPDRVFREADALAKRLKLSRSALYAEAIEEFVAKWRANRVTEAINKIYSETEPRDEFLDASARKALKNVEW